MKFVLYLLVASVVVQGYIILENFRKEFLILVAICMLQLLFI